MRFRDRQRNRHCIKGDIAGKIREPSRFKFPGQRQKPKSARKSDEGRECENGDRQGHGKGTERQRQNIESETKKNKKTLKQLRERLTQRERDRRTWRERTSHPRIAHGQRYPMPCLE